MTIEMTGTFPRPPVMGLRARLAWEMLFSINKPIWSCVRTEKGYWIVTDDENNLDKAIIFENDEALIKWLDETARDRLETDPIGFLSRLIAVPELMSEHLATEIIMEIDAVYDRKI